MPPMLPQPMIPKRLGVKLHPHEAVLLPLAGLGGEVGFGHLAGQGEDHGDGVLGGGDRIAEGGVHHHHAGGGGGGDVDVVDPDAGAADDLQALGGGDHILVRLGGGADGEAVVLVDDFQQFVFGEPDLGVGVDPAVGEDLDGGGGELVGDEHAGHGIFLWLPSPSKGEGSGMGVWPSTGGGLEREAAPLEPSPAQLARTLTPDPSPLEGEGN